MNLDKKTNAHKKKIHSVYIYSYTKNPNSTYNHNIVR